MGDVGYRARSSKRGGQSDNRSQSFLRHEVDPVTLVKTDRGFIGVYRNSDAERIAAASRAGSERNCAVIPTRGRTASCLNRLDRKLPDLTAPTFHGHGARLRGSRHSHRLAGTMTWAVVVPHRPRQNWAAARGPRQIPCPGAQAGSRAGWSR
jgi:hypothetical protein